LLYSEAVTGRYLAWRYSMPTGARHEITSRERTHGRTAGVSIGRSWARDIR